MPAPNDVLVLSKEEIESVITIDDAIEAVEEGFKAYNSGKAVIPFPVALQVPDHSGDVHIKPGYIKGYDTYTVKIASGFYDNPKAGLPASHGMLLLFDSRTGYPLCIEVDRCYLTDLRTAAAGAVAARALAKKDISRVAVIGTGTQARMQITALSRVRDFDELRVWGRNPQRVKEYVAAMKDSLDARIVPANTAEEAVSGSDIVVTATMATSPVVKASWLSEGMHITAMGSDSPEKQELESAVLGRADKIVVDSLQQCVNLGEVHHAVEDGTITEENVHAELGEVLLGSKSGRESDREITVCDLTGIAVQDVVTSQIVYERALKKKIGSSIRV
jgi:ectoine utilization protein EutC